MGVFDWFKKKENSESEILLESVSKAESQSLEVSSSLELPASSEKSEKTETAEEVKTETIKVTSKDESEKLSLIENKLENLRIYLEMINSKLDKLEVLLKSKGLI